MEGLDCDRMFVAVLEAGSFRGGAARLGTSSGQASKLVSKLETDLGVQLMKRTTRALAPTEVGLSYYERIKIILSELDALHASVKTSSRLPSGRLRLTAPLTFGTVQLLPALIEFAQLYPQIELDVSLSDRNVNLIDEGFDAAIRIGKPVDSSLMARKLCDVRIVVAASPAYLLLRGVPQSSEDLHQHDCIIDTNFKDPYTWRFRTSDGANETTRSVQGRLRFSNAEACLSAAKAGLGITRLPSFIAGVSFCDGSLVPLLGDIESKPSALFALYPAGRHLALKVRALIDFLSERYRGKPVWDHGW